MSSTKEVHQSTSRMFVSTSTAHLLFPFHSFEEEEATDGGDEGIGLELELRPTADDSHSNILHIYPDHQDDQLMIANISLQESNHHDYNEEEETKESSPRAVLDAVIGSGATTDDYDSINMNSTTTSSSSSGCNEQQQSATAADGGEIVETHGSQWKTLITTLLQRKSSKKNKKMTMTTTNSSNYYNKSKSMRRLLTFPPTLTFSDTSTTCNPKKKSLRRKLTAIITSVNSSAVMNDDGEHKIAANSKKKLGHPSASLLMRWKPSWRSFDYHELVSATEDFCDDGLIGRGGYAQVFRGRLEDGQLVAIKRLMKDCSEEERTGDFLSELGVIAHVNHPNAACLLGFGVDGGLHLVLKLSPNGSLASRLHGSSEEKLTWESRYKIALGVAEGLCYLHEGCHRRIIHRDIKAANILLTDDYEPQISDFGLAKWLPDQWTHLEVFPIEGTFGYMAPEYFMHGIVSEKTDVFAFGVVLLELLTGRHAVDSNRQSLVMWAKPLLNDKGLKVLVDPTLREEYDLQQLKRLVSVATLCIHQTPTARPIMKKVIELLKGEENELGITTRKEETKRPSMSFETEDEDYTRSTYLNDLNRHMQLALEQ